MMFSYSIPEEVYGSKAMARFFLLLRNEFKQFQSALVVHLIAVLQPALMYIFMSVIMVVPTFDMYYVDNNTKLGDEFQAAIEEVGSPIGPDYINPIPIEAPDPGNRQVIEIVNIDGKPTALQRFGFIDSNLVKNLRNRLTAAALILWNTDLDGQAVRVGEFPWLPRDIPYTVYFGMAMIPLTAYLSAAMIGGYMMAQEFENGTILEYRLCPTNYLLLLGAKLTRLILTALISSAVLLLMLGLITGVWPSSLLPVFLILIPMAIIAACIGTMAGLLTKSSLPSFLVSLASAFAFWLMGSGFGLAAGFSTTFEKISRLIPNTPVIEMLFPYFYFGRQVAPAPHLARFQLAGYCLALVAGVITIYRQQVKERMK
jgi:ABC-type multidrug transport system permease subunit